VESCFWPLYEVVDGRYRLTYKPEKMVPIEAWLELQKRFSHLLGPEVAGMREQIQQQIEDDWAALLALCGEEAPREHVLATSAS